MHSIPIQLFYKMGIWYRESTLLESRILCLFFIWFKNQSISNASPSLFVCCIFIWLWTLSRVKCFKKRFVNDIYTFLSYVFFFSSSKRAYDSRNLTWLCNFLILFIIVWNMYENLISRRFPFKNSAKYAYIFMIWYIPQVTNENPQNDTTSTFILQLLVLIE